MTVALQKRNFWKLVIGTLGIVYGDIGTSPLYTLNKCFVDGGLSLNEQNILGVISLIFWSLTLVVTIKYVTFIMRADNNKEGGILALTALVNRTTKKAKYQLTITIFGIIGAALLYGDGVITPAISVLGALEGLTVASPKLTHMVVPLSVLILIGLFWYQKQGTAKIGKFFGPIMVVWFVTLGILGLIQIIKNPSIIAALNPYYAYLIFAQNGSVGLHVLGGVVLAITGVEALYADMGHFNKTSIQFAWLALVFPCLVLNYFGQGGLLLQNANAITNPFYLLTPTWALYPTIILATIATIIASQAVISGVFSITSQAVQLGYFPRMRIIHTSSDSRGQVYIPFMNNLLLAFTTLAVILFRSSDNLAAAYGITVTGIMVITTLFTIILSLHGWKWSWLKVALIFVPLLIIDVTFFAVNIIKIQDGGLFTIFITVCIIATIYAWKRGKSVLSKTEEISQYSFLDLPKQTDTRQHGTAVFMSESKGQFPHSLNIYLKINRILHSKVLVLTIVTQDKPRVPPSERIKIRNRKGGVFQVTANYGFIEIPDMHHIFEQVKEKGIDVKLSETSFFISHGVPIATASPLLVGWVEKLFIILANNEEDPTEFYKIPHEQVIELGIRYRV